VNPSCIPSRKAPCLRRSSIVASIGARHLPKSPGSQAPAATAWERVGAFGSRLCSAESLSARVTHRGSHLPGVTDRPTKWDRQNGTDNSFNRCPSIGARHLLKSPRSQAPTATAWERVGAFGSRLCSAESLSARVTHRGSHLPGVTDRQKGTGKRTRLNSLLCSPVSYSDRRLLVSSGGMSTCLVM